MRGCFRCWLLNMAHAAARAEIRETEGFRIVMQGVAVGMHGVGWKWLVQA